MTDMLSTHLEASQAANEPAAHQHALGQRPALLRMAHIGKTFSGGVTALQDLNLNVGQGDFVSLLGPSGCGKSTALRLIAGLMQPTAGSIEWHGGRGEGDLGIVFQEPTLMPWARVQDNVWLPLRLRGKRYASVASDVEQALSLVGLQDFHNAFPRELSGGMKMRVSIARALVTRPRLLLMDEPFAALDEITRHRLNKDLLELRESIGCTVIFVTHSVFESIFLSDRIVVMATSPGRSIGELTVDAPYPRSDAFRTSPQYSASARDASVMLARAMDPAR